MIERSVDLPQPEGPRDRDIFPFVNIEVNALQSMCFHFLCEEDFLYTFQVDD